VNSQYSLTIKGLRLIDNEVIVITLKASLSLGNPEDQCP
jgi:hypothetical protein